ncbi:Ldh family oxidoreductase [Ochrobactrum chromiisoli]|uniref:Ldh family oxidoreductase n=1 Tax=Ochrobactrum chromiisoli TaxID=2993941 RepID=A0ABT3QSI1_9HYPH|nr:Ldh family oxidoreductase [Ochrobactrum chromiisoli]MCX2698575.1 Ldh family oxidoreductase [Ochrobactrum chromiisoli]
MTVRKSFCEVVTAVENALLANGYSAKSARILADNCVKAHRDGYISTGLFRIGDYVSTIKSGYVNGDPTPVIEDVAPGFLRVNADNGFAQIALDTAKQTLMRKATQNGIAILAIRNSHHLSSLYLDIEELAEAGYIAVALANSIPVVSPPGGKKGIYGTNPLAFACPRANGAPVIFDQSASVMSHGDVQLAAIEGRKLDWGSGICKDGNLTDDPNKILNGGAIATFGGHKGASIALMVEILCAGLVGADFSFEVNWNDTPGAKTARTGETIIVIDPSKGDAGRASFSNRIEALISALLDAGQSHIPGDRRVRSRQVSSEFLEIDEEAWALISKMQMLQGTA